VNNKRTRTSPLLVESLERREVLSTALDIPLAQAAHHLHTHVPGAVSTAKVHTKLLAGSGQANVVSQIELPHFRTQTSFNASGRANLLGRYSGQLVTILEIDNSHFTGNASFTGTSGELDFSINGSFHGRSRFRPFSGKFVITGGTGTFAGSMGKGSISGVSNGSTGGLTFAFNGLLKS
jgi:hypothetical protein